MTAKAFIVIATLAIAAFIVGVGRYNMDYPDSRHADVLKPAALSGVF